MTVKERQRRDALILADIEKNDATYPVIAARHGVSRNIVSWIARREGHQRQTPPGKSERAPKACSGCGVTIRAKGDLCFECRWNSESPSILRKDSGQWVPNGRGIVVWREYAA